MMAPVAAETMVATDGCSQTPVAPARAWEWWVNLRTCQLGGCGLSDKSTHITQGTPMAIITATMESIHQSAQANSSLAKISHLVNWASWKQTHHLPERFGTQAKAIMFTIVANPMGNVPRNSDWPEWRSILVNTDGQMAYLKLCEVSRHSEFFEAKLTLTWSRMRGRARR